jgi:3-phenylpropionate/cinnamic acid dioxygenase small subunit
MLADLTAVRNLLATYAECIDDGDLDAMARLFEHAVMRTDRNPGGYVGEAAVREMQRRFITLYEGRPATKHVTTDIVVTFGSADSASARSSFSVYQCLPDFPLQIVIAGTYSDMLIRDGGGWRFAERRIHAELVGDLRYHVPALLPTHP